MPNTFNLCMCTWFISYLIRSTVYMCTQLMHLFIVLNLKDRHIVLKRSQNHQVHPLNLICFWLWFKMNTFLFVKNSLTFYFSLCTLITKWNKNERQYSINKLTDSSIYTQRKFLWRFPIIQAISKGWKLVPHYKYMWCGTFFNLFCWCACMLNVTFEQPIHLFIQ